MTEPATTKELREVNKTCLKCRGKKFYPVQMILESQMPIIVEVKCEICCEHELGYFKIITGVPLHLIGRYACRMGCGYILDSILRS